MHRCYHPETLILNQTVIISDRDEVHHLCDVLRCSPSDKLSVFNGTGQVAQATIESVSKKAVRVRLISVTEHAKPAPRVVLACAVPKKSKFDTIIEKAGELGVDEIYPLKTARTEASWKMEVDTKKTSRFAAIALSAAKQSQRAYIPDIHGLTPFTKAVDALAEGHTRIIPSLCGEPNNILEVLPKLTPQKAIAIFIGPEGDFTPDEYRYAFDAGCLPVSLGPGILRVETAALCALACVRQYFYNRTPAAHSP